MSQPDEFDESRLPQLAYYVPPVVLRREDPADWLKCLLLFFDGFALSQVHAWDEDMPTLTVALESTGCLHRLDFGDILSVEKPFDLHKALMRQAEHSRNLRRLLTSAARDGIDVSEQRFHELDDPTTDLSVLSMLAPQVREQLSVEIHPVTNYRGQVLNHKAMRRPHRDLKSTSIIELDLATVTFDLSAVPLDEVLDFRRQHGYQFRSYRRQLNQLLIALSLVQDGDRASLLADRREELRDLQAQLQQRTRLAFKLKKLIPFGLGMTGAILTGASGDYLGATGGAAGALGALGGDGPSRLGAYSYLFSAQEKWKNR